MSRVREPRTRRPSKPRLLRRSAQPLLICALVAAAAPSPLPPVLRTARATNWSCTTAKSSRSTSATPSLPPSSSAVAKSRRSLPPAAFPGTMLAPGLSICAATPRFPASSIATNTLSLSPNGPATTRVSIPPPPSPRFKRHSPPRENRQARRLDHRRRRMEPGAACREAPPHFGRTGCGRAE